MAEEESSHPAVELDETVHQRVRLGVLAILVEADRANFTYLRDTLGVTDGNLSAHLNVLVNAGLVQLRQALRRGAAAHLGARHAEGPYHVPSRG